MWTRNYQNIIYANAICKSIGYTGTSANAFGDNHCLNYKEPGGTLREICTWSSNVSSYFNKGTFIARITNAAENKFYSAPVTLTDQTATIVGDGFYHKIMIGFGSSATPATFEDYALESFISNVTEKSGTGVVTINDDGTFTIDYQIIISATADITIREVGLFLPTSYRPGTSSSMVHGSYALINRIVLDEPVSIAKDSVGNITFSITTPKITIS